MKVHSRSLAIISIVLLIALLACAAPAAAPTTTPATPAAQVEPIVLKFVCWLPPAHLANAQFLESSQRITDKTGGKVKIDYYPGEQLAKAKEQYDSLVAGRFDGANATMAGYYLGRFPITQIGELPFMIPGGTIETANLIIREAYDSSKAAQAEWAQTKTWPTFYTGRYTLGTVNKKVTCLEDLKGLKLKSMSGPANEALKALGAIPVDVTAPEMYNALQTGMVDGMFYVTASWPSFHLEEVCKYMVTDGLYSTTAGLSMNWDSWNKLPKDIQDAIDEEFRHFSTDVGARYDIEDGKAMEKIKAKNLTISSLTKEELARWVEVCKPVHEAYLGTLKDPAGGREYYDALLRGNAKYLK